MVQCIHRLRSLPRPCRATSSVSYRGVILVLHSLLTLYSRPRVLNHGCVRPDMRYCSRSRCFHPDPGTKHLSVPPRHMTMPYAPDFQHDITTLQLQGYNISYNRHTTALIQYISGRYMSEYILQSNP